MRHRSLGRAALLLAVLLAAPGRAAAGPPAARAELPPLDAATSLLVVAPHPDDETLCCAGVMQRVAAAGGHVSVVWVTSGDASELDLLLVEHSPFMRAAAARDLATRRMREARAATALLGVPAGGQLFLGYPDRGLLQLLTAHRTQPLTAPFSGAAAVPYAQALYPGHPYTGASLEADFAAVLERVHPTLILAPTPRDSHPDHRAAGLLTTTVAQRLQLLPAVRYWIVHGGEGWPSPRGLVPGLPLTPAPRLRALMPAVFALTPAEEDRKQQAIEAYATQMQVIAPFLLSFVRSSELFTNAAQP
ncbi:MAG TPA: PIG-L family deacetylase [Steroidobacteraceae bacterium]|nr:PIG-L family deacetylase [Steroidobacteraceae bacterium]